MNSIQLVGRAGRDPEVRYFESGTMVANLSLAVRGQKKDETDWFNLTIWGKSAQVAADYVKKGSMIGVIGRVTTEKWTDKQGEERSKPVVVVDRLELLGSRSDNEGASPAGNRTAASAPAAPGDDEIPF